MDEIKSKNSWDMLWQNKGKDEEFDPVALIGYDKAIDVPVNDFVNQVITLIEQKLKLSASDCLLEVGCGAGMLLIPLSKSVKESVGADISGALLSKLKTAYPELFLCLSEAIKLPFQSETYTKVLVHSVFQYFPSFDYAENVLLELLRVCKKKGLIFIMDIPDIEKKGECVSYLKKIHPEKVSDKLQHLFYSKGFFEEICMKNKSRCEIFDQNIKGYENSRFRFNILIEK